MKIKGGRDKERRRKLSRRGERRGEETWEKRKGKKGERERRKGIALYRPNRVYDNRYIRPTFPERPACFGPATINIRTQSYI